MTIINKIVLNKLIDLSLTYIKTIEKTVKNNNKTFINLLTDGKEFITVTEWNSSKFNNIRKNVNVSISNAFVKKMILNQYTIQINENNVVFDLNSNTIINENKKPSATYEKYKEIYFTLKLYQ
jgi:hypothetical protein